MGHSKHAGGTVRPFDYRPVSDPGSPCAVILENRLPGSLGNHGIMLAGSLAGSLRITYVRGYGDHSPCLETRSDTTAAGIGGRCGL